MQGEPLWAEQGERAGEEAKMRLKKIKNVLSIAQNFIGLALKTVSNEFFKKYLPSQIHKIKEAVSYLLFF